MTHNSGYTCGNCGSPIPVTNVAVGKQTVWDKLVRNRYPISHFWCDNCDAITVIRKTVLERDWVEFHIGHLRIRDQEKELAEMAAKKWVGYIGNDREDAR